MTVSERRLTYHHAVPAGFSFGMDQGDKIMLWTIIIILLVLWALGFGFAGQSLGALVHVLLVVALVVLVVQLIQGRRVN